MRGDEMRGAGNVLIMTQCEGKQWNCKQRRGRNNKEKKISKETIKETYHKQQMKYKRN